MLLFRYLPFTLIASFHRVLALTSDLALIINAVKESDKLEVYNDFKVRTKSDPTKWPLGRDDPAETAHLGITIAANLVTAEPANVVVPLSNTLTNIPPPPVLRNSRRANANTAPTSISADENNKPAKVDMTEMVHKVETEEAPLDPAADINDGNLAISKTKSTDDSNIWTEVKRQVMIEFRLLSKIILNILFVIIVTTFQTCQGLGSTSTFSR